MDVSLTEWTITAVVTVAVLLFDVVAIARHPHEPTNKESSIALSVYVGLAIIFGVWVWAFHGQDFGIEFYAGWLTEYSLSVDNLFVFIILMGALKVPRKFQQEALMVGIVLALILRAVFIGIGAAAINNIAWIFYIFGAFLVYTAIGLVRSYRSHEDDDYHENRIVRFARKRLNMTEEFHGLKLAVVENGKRAVTPMAIVILALGTTDLLFALDSIPAIYGLTKEPYIVFTANVFALMGLRQLYFLLGGLLQRLVYLSLGLAVILAFIGVKLVLTALHENELPFLNGGEPVPVYEIPTLLSLAVILVALAVTAAASLFKTRSEESRESDEWFPSKQAED